MKIVFTAILSFSLFLQQSPLRSLTVGNVDYFTADQFGNLYIVQLDQLIKIDKNDTKVFTYSNPLVGTIHTVSALDPMNLLLFYKDQSRVTTLDNRLSESTAAEFSNFNLSDVQLVSQSDENNIWVYEQSTDKIYRLNINQKSVSNKSLNITQLVNKENNPLQLESTYENVYLNIPETGILMFDATGALLKTIPIKGIDYFFLSGKMLFFLRENAIFRFNLVNNKQEKLSITSGKIKSFALRDNTLYVLTPQRIDIYTLNP